VFDASATTGSRARRPEAGVPRHALEKDADLKTVWLGLRD
jgi:hypothetical protein